MLHAPEGDVSAPVSVVTAPSEAADLVILATKAPQARGAARGAASWIGDAPVLAIQNGLGVADEVAGALPGSAVVTGVTYQGANVVAEGEVNHVANGPTRLGYAGRPADALVEAVAALLESAGFPTGVEADVTGAVWGKLVVNAAMNPVAALAGVVNGEVARRPSLRVLVSAIAEEGAAAARAESVELPYGEAAEAALETARQTAANRCSMLQDMEAGRGTEIEYLNGAIVRTAEAHALEAPANRAIASLVRQVSASQGKGTA